MGTNRDDRSLFGREERVMESCRAELSVEKYEGNKLLSGYKELLASYQKLLKTSRKITRISDSQGRVLKERELKIKSLLDNSNQGFLTFGADLLVDGEYSAQCVVIFGREIRKENITALLGNNEAERQRYASVFTAVFREKSGAGLTQLPAKIIINGRYIDVKYKLIDWLDEDYVVLVILTDDTEKIQSEARVKYLIEHDSLTSLYNRSYIDKVVPRLIVSRNLPLSIILADMNALKLTNDVFGHQAGDRLIVKVGQIIKKCCRETDVVARWGGDEFLVLLPNTGRVQCQKIVEEINRACREESRDEVTISVSMGTTTLDSINMNINELYAVAENRMYKNKLLNNRSVRRNIIAKTEAVLEARGLVPPGHIERMKNLSVRFAGVLGFAEESVETNKLLLLSSLHDVGKFAIPADILKKPEHLTPKEWEIVKSYPEVGYRMAQSIGEPGVAEAILSLHERWDGTGYPYGLKGAQIPYLSRVFSILESFDLMTRDRVFQRAVSEEEALAEIRWQSGKQFDPGLTELFCDNIHRLVG